MFDFLKRLYFQICSRIYTNINNSFNDEFIQNSKINNTYKRKFYFLC